MKLPFFLLHNAKACELCVICCNFLVVAIVWVDHEGFFLRYLDASLKQSTVVDDEWKNLAIISEDGNYTHVKVHYIYVEEFDDKEDGNHD